MRYKITVEYDGTNYDGWQRQKNSARKSIQEVLETAVTKITDENPEVFAAGRTDAGVHALGQVCHFDLANSIAADKLMGGLNSQLKDEGVAVLACEQVSANFHSRFDAKKRFYRYLIINRYAQPKLQHLRAWHFPTKLDAAKMMRAAKFLLGQHDFTSFRDSKCQAKNAIKTIDSLTIDRFSDEIKIEISAQSFLHHMVRNIVGTLACVGAGKFEPEDLKEILAAKDRTRSGLNAPAHGLYFLKVEY